MPYIFSSILTSLNGRPNVYANHNEKGLAVFVLIISYASTECIVFLFQVLISRNSSILRFALAYIGEFKKNET